MAIRTAVNRALTAITALPTAAAFVNGNLTLLTTATASSSATLDFTSGIDDTYDSYVFKFINIHPATDGATLELEGSINGGSGYGITKTTTYFTAYQGEGDGGAALTYYADEDLAQSTASQNITHYQGNANDESASGEITIYNPSSTTFVKHFMTVHNEATLHNHTVSNHVAGYFNTTSAINAIRFSMSSGNIDSGVIKLYGVGDKQ
jgi:hypothetical protein